MQTSSQGGSPSPKAKKAGASFVKSAGGNSVRPASDRGETSVGPSHCESDRKHFEAAYGGSGYR